MTAPPAGSVTFATRVLRKQDSLPRYIVVRAEHASREGVAYPAMVLLNGTGPFPRNIRPWGKGSDVFFFNLTEPQCRKAGLKTNDPVTVTIMPPG